MLAWSKPDIIGNVGNHNSEVLHVTVAKVRSPKAEKDYVEILAIRQTFLFRPSYQSLQRLLANPSLETLQLLSETFKK